MMRGKPIFVVFGVVPLAAAIVSCGGGEQPKETGVPGAASIGKPIDKATAGSVTGTIKLDGTPPKMKVINMAAEPACAKVHTQPAMTQDAVLGKNSALQNAVVYLKGDFSAYAFETPATPVVIDQSGCMYSPHVIGVGVGQPLRVTNSDPVTHNIHPMPKNNREWNQSQVPGSAPIMESFAREEIAIPVKCNIHPWMKSYVAVSSTPYFQVTGTDGSFNLTNVPPGAYTLAVWHERYGMKEQTVTIGASESKVVNITFAATSAAD